MSLCGASLPRAALLWRRRRRCAPPRASAAASAATVLSVPRSSAARLSPADFAALYDGRPTPVLLTDVWPGLDHGAWLAQVVERLGKRRVVYQVQRSGITELFEAPLRAFLDELVADSRHGAARFLFDEEALAGAPAALRLSPLPPPLFDGVDDGFDAFPAALRPAGACLLMGGTGARSSLHADPYSWTGWNYLLEGEKLWTFLPPGAAADAALAAVRKTPNAWGDGVDVAAGWESSVDLYRHRAKRSSLGTAVAPTPEAEAAAFGAFTPSAPLPAALAASAVRCVQREGELLLIPPAMWHQTYHLGPTAAVAGQYCNERNARGVFRHILGWCGVGDSEAEALLTTSAFCDAPLPTRVDAVLRAALQRRHGEAAGDELLARLRAPASDATDNSAGDGRVTGPPRRKARKGND